MPPDLDPTTDFIAGTIAGIAGLLIAHPFDTVKVRLQHPDLSSRYHSVTHAFATIIKEERFSGLFKGIASPLATCGFMNGLVFAAYKFFLKAQMPDDSIPSLTQVAIAGSCCGVVMSLFSAPIELIKIRQQNMLESGLGSVSVSKLIYTIHRENGLKGLFRGLTATALRDIGYGAYFFGSTETAEARSIMRSEVTTGDNPYRTTISTIQHSYRTGGAGVFFRGLSPTMLRAIPVNMATFAVYETVAGMLSP